MKLKFALKSLVAACVFGTALSTAVHAADPIKVGVVVAKSPPGSVVQGTQVLHGLEIAQEIINSAGGVNGRKIELVVEDDQGTPEKGRAAAEKLVGRDKVVAITGPHASGVALGMIESLRSTGVPFINTNAWSDDIRIKAVPNVFNPNNYNTRVVQAMAETIVAMKVKKVRAFPENTDYGIGQAELLKKTLAAMAPGIDFSYAAIDRAGKDFLPAVISLKRDQPDMVVTMLLPPAAYIFMNQLYEQGVAPSKKTILFDGAGIADYPDFWQNVKEAGKNMLSFGLYHPSMKLTPIGNKVTVMYREKHKTEPNRLIYQAADSLFLIAESIKKAGGTNQAKMITALRDMKYEGTRGNIVFSKESGFKFQQWIDVPYVIYQLTATNQKLADSPLILQPGMAVDLGKLQR